MSMIIDGTNGLTFNNATTQNSGGKVLQALNSTFNTSSNTSSNSYVDSGLTISITPLFSTSKILVFANISGIYINNSGNFLQGQIVRNSTGLIGDFINVSGYNGTTNGTGGGTGSVTYLDSPATTSATTYKIQVRSATSAQTVYWCNGSSYSTITVMEIAQ